MFVALLNFPRWSIVTFQQRFSLFVELMVEMTNEAAHNSEISSAESTVTTTDSTICNNQLDQHNPFDFTCFEDLFHCLPLKNTFDLYHNGLTDKNQHIRQPVFYSRDAAFQFAKNVAQQCGFNIRIKTSTTNDKVLFIDMTALRTKEFCSLAFLRNSFVVNVRVLLKMVGNRKMESERETEKASDVVANGLVG